MLNRPSDSGQQEAEDPNIHYPESDGEPLAESDYQFYPLTDTVRALGLHFSDRPDVYVAGNMLVYYRGQRRIRASGPGRVRGVRSGRPPAPLLPRMAGGQGPGLRDGDCLGVHRKQRHRRKAQPVRRTGRKTNTGGSTPPGSVWSRRCNAICWRTGDTARWICPPTRKETSGDTANCWGWTFTPCPGETRLHLYDPVKESWLRNLPEAEAALRDEEAAHTDTRAELLLTRAERDDLRAERDAAQERIRQLEERLGNQ